MRRNERAENRPQQGTTTQCDTRLPQQRDGGNDPSSSPTNTASQMHEVYNINGEQFTLTDDIPGDAGWTHICERHLNPTGPDDLKFPRETTEQEVTELIRKTIAQGKWMAQRQSRDNPTASSKKSRLYLWDSRSDPLAQEKGIHQMCVVTTNERRPQHSIITAYPRYGDAISGDDRPRGNQDILTNSSEIETLTDSISRDAAGIVEACDRYQQRILGVQGSETTDTSEFLRTLAHSQSELSHNFDTVHDRLRTTITRNSTFKSRYETGDRKITELLQSEINSAASYKERARSALTDLESSITDGQRQVLEATSGTTQEPSPQGEPSIPQTSNETTEKRITDKKIHDKVKNITRILTEWDQKRSSVLQEAATVSLVYGSGSRYTHYEHRDKVAESLTRIEELKTEQNNTSNEIGTLVYNAKEIDSTHPSIKQAENRTKTALEGSEANINQQLSVTSNTLEGLHRQIEAYERKNENPVVKSNEAVRYILEDAAHMDSVLSHVEDLERFKRAVLNLNHRFSKIQTPQSVLIRREAPPTLQSLPKKVLERIRQNPDLKFNFKKVYRLNNRYQGESDQYMQNAEQNASAVTEIAKYIKNSQKAHQNIQFAENRTRELRETKSKIDRCISSTYSDMNYMFPGLAEGESPTEKADDVIRYLFEGIDLMNGVLSHTEDTEKQKKAIIDQSCRSFGYEPPRSGREVPSALQSLPNEILIQLRQTPDLVSKWMKLYQYNNDNRAKADRHMKNAEQNRRFVTEISGSIEDSQKVHQNIKSAEDTTSKLREIKSKIDRHTSSTYDDIKYAFPNMR